MQAYNSLLVLDYSEVIELVEKEFPELTVEFGDSANDTDYFFSFVDGYNFYDDIFFEENEKDRADLYLTPWRLGTALNILRNNKAIPIHDTYVVRVCW